MLKDSKRFENILEDSEDVEGFRKILKGPERF